jgi:hypothetical protein
MQSVRSELDYAFEFDMYSEISAIVADFEEFLKIRDKTK